ncbi:MAG: hypothetical protein IH586_22855, partial [Anaerolineaceae bacterium]|nr:hypothetical protein [Anaerolineaceae bacterium]
MKIKPWHTQTRDEAFLQFQSLPGGLSSPEAVSRLQKYGPNELQATHRISAWEILL